MDENIGYSNEEDEERKVSSQWHLATESIISLEKESSKEFLQYRNYHLHLIQKKEPASERRVIPSTKSERLSFYRNYTSSPNKTQIACMHMKTFNRFFWEYLENTIYKSMQHTFVNIFLASYVPEEHLFLSKMVPLMHGIKFCFIITGLLEVISYISNTTVLLDYLVGSIFLKTPWNRCPEDGYYHYKTATRDLKINCYNVLDFGERVKNKTIGFYKLYYYIYEDAELLQIVQIEYFRYRLLTISFELKFFYTCFIWGLIIVCHNQIYTRNFWKIMNIFHWSVISLDIVSFMYLMFYYFGEDFFIPHIEKSLIVLHAHSFSHADFNFLAESTTAPPVVHVLTARSTQEILPGRDSAVIIFSNAFCCLFRALLSYRVKQHCENLVKVPILMPGSVENAWLFFWPMYFSTFFLGDMYTLVFLVLHFASEVMTTVVTFQCLLEAVLNEWPRLSKWILTTFLIVLSVVFATSVPVDLTLVLAYNKGTATMLECFVLYCMYPVYRLMDDISFHYGSAPHIIRKQFLVIVPFYYMIKYYYLINSTASLLVEDYSKKRRTLFLAFFLMIVPLSAGMVYALYKYVWLDSRSWKRMFAPIEDWGPRDYNTRQLRKNFDSRTYNNSQAPRNLSRHIIGKAEAKAYRLDIRYDPTRRSTLANLELRTENEKDKIRTSSASTVLVDRII